MCCASDTILLLAYWQQLLLFSSCKGFQTPTFRAGKMTSFLRIVSYIPARNITFLLIL